MTATNSRTGCKGCRKTEAISEQEIDELINEQLLLETDLVDDDIYNSRITQCNNCSSLTGRTCFHCGCYVQFRARIGFKHCPHPQGAKW